MNNTTYTSTIEASYDDGLRKIMNMILGNTAIGLAFTAIAAYVGNILNVHQIIGPVGILIVAFMPIVLILAYAAIESKLSQVGLWAFYIIFCTAFGIPLSALFSTYTASNIISAFFMTSSLFLSASLYGYITKHDLTRVGSFLVIALIGLLIVSVFNIFFYSGIVTLIIQLSTVIIFTGLTAYDIQNAKNEYIHKAKVSSTIDLSRMAMRYTLGLYLNFLNIFLALLGMQND
jgi:FtsH-binding integral membrane protein